MAATGGRASDDSLRGEESSSAAGVTSRVERSWSVRLRGIAPFAAALLTTGWVFRETLFGGRLPGDIGDARWTIGVHEHWYAVWRGLESVRDLHYYFPLRGTLGTSDAFLVQGQFYSLARALGLGLVNSWVVAQVMFFILGAIGVAVLSRQVLAGWCSQVAFVALCCASYPIVSSMNHVQIIGFLSASWVFVGGHAILTRAHLRMGWALVVVVPPLLALSSWYALVLLAFILAILAAFVLLFSRPTAVLALLSTTWRDVLSVMRSPTGALLLVTFAVGWGSVLWVYLPGSAMLPAPQWPEVINYSPRFSDIFNAASGGGGLWSPFYRLWTTGPQPNEERAFGFTPILLVAFLVIGLLHIRSVVLGRRIACANGLAGQTGLLAVWFTVIFSVSMFLVDDRGLSLYRLFWTYLPGLQSIRAPFRVQVFGYALALFLVLRSSELRLQRPADGRRTVSHRKVSAIGAAVLVVLIAAEMQRLPSAGWTAADLLSPRLLAQVEQAQRRCDAVIILDEKPKELSYVNRVDAVIFSALSGLPTPQGYSRADPKGYPGSGVDPRILAEWVRQQGTSGRVCTVSSKGVVLIP